MISLYMLTFKDAKCKPIKTYAIFALFFNSKLLEIDMDTKNDMSPRVARISNDISFFFSKTVVVAIYMY